MSNLEKSYKFNRQTNDFLLTDLLPYEKGNHYTHIYFYEYLQSNKKSLSKLYKKISSKDVFFDGTWHSSPLKFKISKAKDNFREISLINPLGLIESLAFVNLFENDIINIVQNKKDFSSRKASRVNNLTYKKNKYQTVLYTDDPNSKKQLLISLESKGTYFRHFPFKTITQLLNSKRFIYSRDKYNLLLVVDIQDCFPSIYSHSYKWLISNKVYDSKNLKNSNSVYKNIDVFLQNINGSKTNGIIVGPEVSRLLADFLFVHIDQDLIEILKEKNINIGKEYIIYRFVDDYYICTNNEDVQNNIKEELANILNIYQLKINESKVKILGKDEILNGWLLEVLPIISLIEQIFIIEKESDYADIKHLSLPLQEQLKESFLQVAATLSNLEESRKDLKTQSKKVRYIDLRIMVNGVILSTKEHSLVSSYILSTVLKKVEEKKYSINMEINELITFIFFTYSKKITYSSTQKVIRILTLLIEKEYDVVKPMIESNIERFENEIFKKYSSDWIDLLLFFSSYEINLTTNLMDKITSIILREENPTHIAALCLFYESKSINSTNFFKKVNKIIESKIQHLNWEDFFQDELCWWVFVYMSYPKINKKLKKDIIRNLTDIKNAFKETSSDDAKSIVLEFLLKKDEHFIEWNFTKENYHKKFYFYTKDRTVFNPDIIDQINISR